MHACVWRVYVLALCDSQLHPTSSNKVKRAFISAPDSPPRATGITVLHTRTNAARAAQQHAAQIHYERTDLQLRLNLFVANRLKVFMLD